MTERVTIETEPNGPYIVRGPVTLIDPDGARREFGPDSVIKLCRCGHSARKPFCDQHASPRGLRVASAVRARAQTLRDACGSGLDRSAGLRVRHHETPHVRREQQAGDRGRERDVAGEPERGAEVR